jgi:hypothetical protein
VALTITYKGKIASTTAATSYTATTSWTPTSNSLLVAFVVTCLGSSPIDPTSVTGHGQTYAKVTGFSAYTLSTTHLLSIWVAKAGGSPSNSAASASYGAVNQTGGVVIEYEITGADLAGTAAQAILQTVTATGTATSHTSTNLLAAAGSTDNRSMAFCVHLANEATTPAGGNWTETAGADGNFNTPPTGAEVQHTASTFDRSPAASWTTSSAYRVFAIEVKNDQAKSVSLTGQAVTLGQGTLTPVAYDAQVSWAELDVPLAAGNPTLTGLAATAAQGTLGVSHTQALTGQEAAVAQGAVVAAHAQPLTGQELATAQGVLGTQRVLALGGLAASVAGTGPTAAHAQPLTGQEVATAAGALGAARSVTLTGQEAATAQGALAPALVVSLTGQSVTVEQGALTPQTASSVVVQLGGLQATVEQGDLGTAREHALLGMDAVVEAGDIVVGQEGLPTGGAVYTGGWIERESPYVVLRRQIEAERKARAITKRASVVIERVAREQVQHTTVADEVARTAALVKALERAGIAWQQQFDAALDAYRSYLMTAEIAMLLEARGIYAEIDRREAEYYNAAATLLLLTEH